MKVDFIPEEWGLLIASYNLLSSVSLVCNKAIPDLVFPFIIQNFVSDNHNLVFFFAFFLKDF
jgi:hypothetical protein